MTYLQYGSEVCRLVCKYHYLLHIVLFSIFSELQWGKNRKKPHYIYYKNHVFLMKNKIELSEVYFQCLIANYKDIRARRGNLFLVCRISLYMRRRWSERKIQNKLMNKNEPTTDVNRGSKRTEAGHI